MTFPCVEQNPTVTAYLSVVGQGRSSMDKVVINMISPSKDGSYFCMALSVRERWTRSGPSFPDKGQGHGMNLNIFPTYHLNNYLFSALAHQNKLKLD